MLGEYLEDRTPEFGAILCLMLKIAHSVLLLSLPGMNLSPVGLSLLRSIHTVVMTTSTTHIQGQGQVYLQSLSIVLPPTPEKSEFKQNKDVSEITFVPLECSTPAYESYKPLPVPCNNYD